MPLFIVHSDNDTQAKGEKVKIYASLGQAEIRANRVAADFPHSEVSSSELVLRKTISFQRSVVNHN